METFQPYTIHHIQLQTLNDFVPHVSKNYIVCWYKEIPLGHIWTENEESMANFKKSIIDAITPTLTYYLEQQGIKDLIWKDYLDAQKFETVTNFLDANQITAQSQNDISAQKLSVIICTRNRADALERCMEKLMESTDKDFELIVVDNAPDNDSTVAVVKKFANVRYVLEEKKGLDFARNAGLKAASNPIIAFTDDDVVVDKEWTARIKTSFQNPLTMAVTGLVIPAELETESQCIFEKYWSFNKGYLPIVFDHKFFVANLDIGVPVWKIGAGANCAFRAEIFDIVGTFDTRLGAGASGCSDDTELWYRVLAAGWNCNYIPTLFVYHQHRRSKEELQKQLLHYMRGHACALLVQYEKYHDKGNLRRLYKLLPQYYYHGIKQKLKGKGESFKTVFLEMRGCFLGWLYYHARKKDPGYDFPVRIPEILKKPVQIDSRSMVSVIIPCHNHAKYLGKSIESVLSQTYPHTEVIVVDDGSNDDPLSVCKKYDRVKYVRVERVGVSAARNIGVKYSNGDFLVFLDADDFLYPEGIQNNLEYFSTNKDLVLVSGAHDRVNSSGNILPGDKATERPTNNYQALLQGNYIGMEATVMYRRDLFFAFHFDSRLRLGEDYDLNMNIARYFPVYGHTKKIAAYHIHDSNTSRDNILMLKTTLNVLKRQEKSLKNDAEREAMNSGINNWNYYYKHVASQKNDI